MVIYHFRVRLLAITKRTALRHHNLPLVFKCLWSTQWHTPEHWLGQDFKLSIIYAQGLILQKQAAPFSNYPARRSHRDYQPIPQIHQGFLLV